MSGSRQRQKAKAAAAGRRSAALGVEDAIAEVAAAEGAAADAEAEPHAKPAPRQQKAAPQPAPPSEPTQRQKVVEAAKEKEMYQAMNDTGKRLTEILNQSEREKQQLKEAQKAKGGRCASQEHKPIKTNAQRRQDRVFVETHLKDHTILSFDAVRKTDCMSPAGCPPFTTQVVTQLILFSSFILFDEYIFLR
jgi:hypothetical protein